MILPITALLTLLPNKSVIGQNGNFANATISVNIIVPIAAQENSQLTFGKFFPGDGGKITITPNGSVITTNNIVIDNRTQTPGSFIISGEINSAINISLPNTPIAIINENASSMIVDNWNSNKNIQLDEGSQTISIGATLNVGPINENPKGIYTGTYQITFSYN